MNKQELAEWMFKVSEKTAEHKTDWKENYCTYYTSSKNLKWFMTDGINGSFETELKNGFTARVFLDSKYKGQNKWSANFNNEKKMLSEGCPLDVKMEKINA